MKLLTADRKVSRLLKMTKGESFGFTPTCDDASPFPREWFPLLPATPVQYLQRMALLNELRPELETRLEGFAVVEEKLVVVTSQRFIDPAAAPQPAISAFFGERGFEQLSEFAWYHTHLNLAVFDVTPANVLEYDGRLYPVDIMPVEPRPMMRRLIRRALKMPFESR